MRIASERMQSRSDFDPYEGYDAVGWPLKTIVRGRLVVDRGELLAEPAAGELLAAAPTTRSDRVPRGSRPCSTAVLPLSRPGSVEGARIATAVADAAVGLITEDG